MRKWFYLINGMLILLLITVPLEGYFLIPLYPWVEKVTNQNRILIISQSVSESFKSLTYYNGKIYYQNRKVGYFTSLSLYRLPIPSFSWQCNQGILKITPNIRFLNVSFKKFGCLVYAKEITGNIKISQKEIYGKVIIKGLKATDFPIRELDKLNIIFNGKKFEVTVKIGKELVKGTGKLELNLLNLKESKVKANFYGNGFSFTLSGSLFNPQVVWK